MDPTWLLVALVLVVLFSAISIVGVLKRIASACERAAAAAESQAHAHARERYPEQQ